MALYLLQKEKFFMIIKQKRYVELWWKIFFSSQREIQYFKRTCNSGPKNYSSSIFELSLNRDAFCGILQNPEKTKQKKKKQKKKQTVTPSVSWIQGIWVSCCVCSVWTNSLLAGRVRPLDPYIIILYWIPKIYSKFKYQESRTVCIRI